MVSPALAPGARIPSTAGPWLPRRFLTGIEEIARTPYGYIPDSAKFSAQRSTEGLFPNLHVSADPEPDRRSAEVLRALPADEPAARGAGQPGSAVRLHQHLPVLGLPGDLLARLRPLLDRRLAVQVR